VPGDTEHLETRVRDALGRGLAGYRASDAAQARANVLGGIRRGRRHRLQVATGGFAVALALACSLLLAVGGGTTTPSKGVTTAGRASLPNREPPTATTAATCEVDGETSVVPCGLVGSAAVNSRESSATSASPSATGGSTAVGSAARPLVLRVGQDAAVELPRPSARHRWQPLRPVTDPLANGHRIVTIQRTARPDVWRLVAEHDGSMVVRSHRSGCGHGMPCPARASTWSLYVEVTS
jgi:hypothetical protein